MSREYDERFAELARWWHYHRGTLPPENLKARCDFLEKMCTNLLDLHALATRDLERLEGARRKLYLPTGISVAGDVKRFG